MFLLVQTTQSLYTIDLSNTISGSFQIHNQSVVIAKVRAYKNQWQLCAETGICINQRETMLFLKEHAIYVLSDSEDNKVLLYVKENIPVKYHKYICKSNFTIGRHASCDICYHNPFVSGLHVVVEKRGYEYYVQDQHSSNYTYVNGIRFYEGDVYIGDVITIMGLQIIIGVGFLAMQEQEEGNISLSTIFSPYIQQEKGKVISTQSNKVPFAYRPIPVYNKIKIDVQEPPMEELNRDIPFWIKLGPSLFMGIIAIVNVGFMIQRLSDEQSFTNVIPSMLMSISMFFTACLFPFITNRYQRKKADQVQREHKLNYDCYLQVLQQQIDKEKQKEKTYLQYAFPPLDELFLTSTYGYVTTTDYSFLKIRIGIGCSTVSTEIAKHHKFSLDMKEVPISIDITKQYIIGITGSDLQIQSFMEKFILMACFTHSHKDLKIACIGKKIPPMLRWLPHLNYLQMHCYIHDEDAAMAFQTALQMQLNENKIQQAFLICLFDQELQGCQSILEQIRTREYQGISLVSCSQHKDKHSLFLLDLSQSYYQMRQDIQPRAIVIDESKYIKKACRFLAQQEDSNTAFQFPEIFPFLSMFQIQSIEELNVWKRWERHQSYKTLATCIGIHENGDLLALDIHEKAHGPHGLFAGMTGSGKSECILTYVLSMAVNYHPEDVQFLLIDYKGGGLAKLLENLPHTVGTITNLEESLLQRTFISIQSEILKRQTILKETAIQFQIANLSINEYQKMYFEHKVSIAMSHLFIICDEFAELKMQQPIYMDQLISMARIGRSLGIHLLLATQKPSGIVNDQIWSNTHFHLCMKVADKADSMDMIHRPDSAYIIQSGQFYLQIGNNEAFMKGFSAWSQAPYTEANAKYFNQSVKVLSKTRAITYKCSLQSLSTVQHKTQFEIVVNHLIQCAKMKKIGKHFIWKPPLMQSSSITKLEKKYKKRMDYVLVGEQDDVVKQSYQGFYIPVNTNTICYGSKDQKQLLEVLIHSFLHTYTSQQMQLYCLDMLNELSQLKTTKSILHYINSKDEQDIKHFFETLKKERTFKYVILHGISAITNYHSTLMQYIKESSHTHIYFFITAQHEEEVPYQLRSYFGYNLALHMEKKEQLASVLNCHIKQTLPYQKGKGYYYDNQLCEFQIACLS